MNNQDIEDFIVRILNQYTDIGPAIERIGAETNLSREEIIYMINGINKQ